MAESCDLAPQVINLAKQDDKKAAMNKMVLPLTMTVLLGLGGLAARADSAAGPSGFHSATESAKSNGETGESADCPIKKTVDGKTFCFQNDPALAKPQGGH